MLDLTVIVPTIGRPTLARTVDSIPKNVRVLVCPDGSDAYDACEAMGVTHKTRDNVSTVYMSHQRLGELGHPQRNHAMTYTPSRWLAFMDDDDTYTPDAFEKIEASLNGNRVPHIFQMRYGKHPNAPPGYVLWQAPVVQFGNVGTPMFVVPNIPEKLGVWPSRIGGDFFFIAETCVKMGDPVWVPEIIAEVRP